MFCNVQYHFSNSHISLSLAAPRLAVCQCRQASTILLTCPYPLLKVCGSWISDPASCHSAVETLFSLDTTTTKVMVVVGMVAVMVVVKVVVTRISANSD